MPPLFSRGGRFVIAESRNDRWRAWVTRRELGINLAIVAVVLVFLTVSLWIIFATSSGALVLTWTGVWGLGAGAAGWYKRSWLWPGLCPVIMLGSILLWAAVFGRTS